MNYDYKEIVPYLLDWFDYNARILPWRENPQPYSVWISEIMLQQTRVEAVKGYFERFMTALPDIESLAEVTEEKLLKLWEGLGYYTRARNLKKAAQMIMDEYDGEVPNSFEKLLKLPGIGEYTAGAIASIAFGFPVPAVDGNVLRITKRVAGSFDDISKESVKKELWQDLNRIMPGNRSGYFNQSIMDLGATICIPNGKPLCEKCPIMHLCKAFHQDTIMQIPVKPAKKERKIEKRTILLLEYQDKYAIRKREGKGLLGGLWELPSLAGKRKGENLLEALDEIGISAESIHPMGEAKHIFSHIEWHMIGYRIRLDQLPSAQVQESLLWADRKDILQNYALPNAFSAYTKGWKQEDMEE